MRLSCPTCKKAVESTAEDFPFCSERCRLIDLGKWASGHYVVPSPLTDSSEEIDAEGLPGQDQDQGNGRR
jgi:endogenous inhibitor of DNA gyrase (YacG/DUF329 family)